MNHIERPAGTVSERVPLHYLRPSYGTQFEPRGVLREEQEQRRAEVSKAFGEAKRLVFVMGGSSRGREADTGALGETILVSGFLKATMAALRAKGKEIPITLIVDDSAKSLYNEEALNQHFAGYYNGRINVVGTTPRTSEQRIEDELQGALEDRIFTLDLHGERSGTGHEIPMLQTSEIGNKTVTTVSTVLTDLFQTGVWEYAGWGPGASGRDAQRRYADFLGTIAGVQDESTILATEAQPFVVPDQGKSFDQLAEEIGLDRSRLQIGVAMQSANVTKEYSPERWQEALNLFSQRLRELFPGVEADLTIFAGPADPHKEGVKADFFWQEPYLTKEILDGAFGGFTGAAGNLVSHVAQLSLVDLATVMNNTAMNVGVDAAPMQLSGALHHPTVVLFLPGQLYPARVWSSSLSHVAVGTDTKTSQEQEDRSYGYKVVDAGRQARTLVDSIPARNVSEAMISTVQAVKTNRPGLLPRKMR